MHWKIAQWPTSGFNNGTRGVQYLKSMSNLKQRGRSPLHDLRYRPTSGNSTQKRDLTLRKVRSRSSSHQSGPKPKYNKTRGESSVFVCRHMVYIVWFCLLTTGFPIPCHTILVWLVSCLKFARRGWWRPIKGKRHVPGASISFLWLGLNGPGYVEWYVFPG